MTDRIIELKKALYRIANMKPHHAGETVNEYHMRQTAIAALAADDKTCSAVYTITERNRARLEDAEIFASLVETMEPASISEDDSPQGYSDETKFALAIAGLMIRALAGKMSHATEDKINE